MKSNSSSPPFLGRNLVCAPPPPEKTCSTSFHVEFWYWERSKKDMLGSLWLKLVTFWWRRHTMAADAAPRILPWWSSFIFVDHHWDILTFTDIFFTRLGFAGLLLKIARDDEKYFPIVERKLLFCLVVFLWWLMRACAICQARNDRLGSRATADKSVNAEEVTRELDLFFFFVVLWVSLLREPSVLEKKKRSISRACTLADANPKM
jgi:hypothetical protein